MSVEIIPCRLLADANNWLSDHLSCESVVIHHLLNCRYIVHHICCITLCVQIFTQIVLVHPGSIYCSFIIIYQPINRQTDSRCTSIVRDLSYIIIV